VIPAVVYAARSQAEEPGRDSTGDQARIVRERLAREPDRAVVAEHADHASGYHGNRGPGLEAAMRDAARAAAEHGRAELWVFKSERLGRGSGRKDEARSVMEVYVECRRAGVDLRSVEDDAFLTNPMLVGVADEMANKYSRDLAAHTRRGIDSRVARGIPWGEPKFPYRKGEGGHWVPVPADAEVARRIFRERGERGLSYSAIARLLTAEGVPTRRGASRWTPTVVKRVIDGREVLGFFRHKGEWIRGKHRAVVTQAAWDAAAALSAQASKYSPGGRCGNQPRTHLLTRGALRCGLCGEAMLPRTEGGREYYVCRTRKTWGACEMPVLGRALVDQITLGLFEGHALDVEATRARVSDLLARRADDTGAQLRRAELDAARKRAALDRYDRDYESGDLPAAEFARLAEKARGELAGAEAEADALRAQAERIAEASGNLDAEHEALRRLADLREAIAGRLAAAPDDVEALRAALAQVFSGVVVHPGDPPRVACLVREELVSDGALPRVAVALGLDPDRCTTSGVPE
jgi:DNA invertase Pin-like site-specific DNA recombinase